GLFYDNGSLWVLHPPNLTVFHDEDRDGAADRYETLLTGVTTDQLRKRGADHTTNGIRVGIDGWIYIAVGDFGMLNCRGVDGRTIRKRGGGVVRVRPDGREMEVYAWGLRNILDVCIDPYMNMFTRDNTNDGGGWDIRLSHVLQSADYGYPSKYMRFSGETMPPLAQYGGGSGCGGMFAHDARWPVEFGDALYTCDWGRSEVYRHRLPKQGPTFAADQDVFLKIPRPTDIDMDAAGRMYVSSWKNGKFDFSGNNVGFVAQITPLDYTPHPAPRLAELGGLELVDQLSSPSAAVRLCAQRAILRQVKTTAGVTDRLVALASDDDAEPAARVAAIYTLKQRLGADSHDALQRLASQPVVREHVLRALTDRIGDLDKAPPVNWFAQFLQDPDPRVRAQAIISLGRIGDRAAAPALLPLTARSDKPLKHHQPDADRVIPHLVTRALIALESTDACAKALAGPHRAGALAALQELHEEESVRAVIASLNGERDDRRRRELVAALVRLYHREGEYDGGWWGTRPDTSGPYYDRKTWAQSAKIAQVIRTAAGDADSETAKWIGDQLVFFKVKIDGVDVAKKKPVAETQKPITIVKADPNDPNAIAQLAPTDVLARAMKRAGDAGRGKELFTRQACVACHTFADGQTPKGPHLVDIGKRYKPAELLESILKPAAKIAQGFETYSFATVDGLVETGFVVRETAEAIHIRRATGVLVVLPRDDVEERVKQSISMMPDGLVDNVTPEQLADLLAYLQSLGGS
ncbi:MAG: HEAT repeat domain-containing protein, partial [Pirellulaceae bacterium]|nr:HEAT repeat domain-containing protein [Pirellulaceae bacterium]